MSSRLLYLLIGLLSLDILADLRSSSNIRKSAIKGLPFSNSSNSVLEQQQQQTFHTKSLIVLNVFVQ